MVAITLVLDFAVTGDVIRMAVLSLIPACLVASANYILNEILDAPFDAMHPTKRLRGIPAGKVKVSILVDQGGAHRGRLYIDLAVGI